MNHTQVVLGYSGGIDSVTAVGILQSLGLDVTALTLDMCGDKALVDHAEKMAVEAEIKFEALSCEELFQSVIKDYFISEYLKGRTPAPCTRCNPMIKWRLLTEYADANNIYHIATGHYFRVERYNGKLYVARAADLRKDQSYYLWALSQETLSRAVTPMSEVIKEHIKSPSTKESMGVCFLRGRNYSEYIGEICGALPHGNIVDSNGAIVGQHRGLAYYTVGQKRGVGIPLGSLVIGLDSSSNSLIIGKDKDLYHTRLIVKECNIVDEEEFLNSADITVIIRGIGRNPEGYATKIEALDDGYSVTLSSPAWACAAGQPVVFYRGDRVIGGGYLESSSI